MRNRRGKLQMLMREERLTDDDLSNPISRVLRNNGVGLCPLRFILDDMDEDDNIDPPPIIVGGNVN